MRNDERAYAEALYDMENIGVSIFDAARDYRVNSILRLRDLAVQRGIKVPNLKGKNEIDVAKLRQMALDGMTVSGMANELYADRQTVARLCSEHGIKAVKDARGGGQRNEQPKPKKFTKPGELSEWVDCDEVPDEYTQRNTSPWPQFVNGFVKSGRKLVSKKYETIDEAVNVAANIRRTARKQALPVTAVARMGTVYMSRIDNADGR